MDSQAYERICHFPLLSKQGVRLDSHSIAANLPLDIFVDNLSPYLQFEDVMALRRVNKHYFHLTHEPLIWKRFLQRLRIPFPPIRPTFDYSAQSSDYEIEQLVSRAISIEDNWRRKRPVVASSVAFDTFFEVFDMKIIPGGKYLVASVGDDHRFFIAVFHLDHPTAPHALFSYRTQGKAYQLQAKYMKYHSRPVVMIAYVCRVLPEGGPASDPNTHMLNCIHADLSVLDFLAHRHQNPSLLETLRESWLSMDDQLKRVVHTIRQPLKPTSQLSLYSRARVAYVSVVQEASADTQDYLVIINVEHPQHPLVVFCRPHNYPHDPLRQLNPLPHMKQWIKAVRHLPEQNHALIWRTIRVDSGAEGERHVHGIELVTLPEQTSAHELRYFSTIPLRGRLVLLDEKIQSVHMTDDIRPYDEECDIYRRDPSTPPPPISVFAETLSPRVIHHWHIWPCRADSTPFAYHPHQSTVTSQLQYNAHPYTAHVIPGVYRSLIYATAPSPGGDTGAPHPLVSLRRYTSPRFYAPANSLAHTYHRSTERRHDCLGAPAAVSAEIDLGPEAAVRYREHGVGVAAWDQTIGRVCLTARGGSIVQVVDFSHATPPDERFVARKMAASAGFGHKEEEGLGPKRKRPRVAA